MLKTILKYSLIMLLLPIFSSCNDKTQQAKPSDVSDKLTLDQEPIITYSAAKNFSLTILAAHQQAASQSQRFCQSIDSFLDNPDTESLLKARQQWQLANSSYLISDIGHWVPLSHEFHWFKRLPYQINAWPIQAGFIDYLNAYSHSGIVNDISLSINKVEIRKQQGLTDEADIILGFHAMEFLLWGEDLSLTVSGQRPVSDYEAIPQLTQEQGRQGLKLDDLANNRRRKLLQVLCTVLQEDLQSLTNSWSITNGSISLFLQSLSLEQQQIIILQTIQNFIVKALLEKQLQAIILDEIDDHDQSSYSDSSREAFSAQIKSLASMFHDLSTSDLKDIDPDTETKAHNPLPAPGLLNRLLNSDIQQSQYLTDLFNKLNVLVLQLPPSFEIMKDATAKTQYLPVIQTISDTLNELNTLITVRIKFLIEQTS